MRPSLSFSCLLLALMICLVSASRADEKKEAKKADPEKEAKDKLISGRVITGKLTRVEGAQKYVTVQVSIPVVVPTLASAANNLALLQQQQAIMRERNPLARQRLILQLLQTAGLGGGSGFQVRQITKDIDLQATDEMKVRILQLPVDFDEKGKPKRYTAKELKELKGDPKLPGYTADFDSLKPDQTVQVHLVKKKDDPKPAVKEKVKDKDRDLPPEEKPEVAMIVILREPIK